jgi:hypothetical protein
MSGAATEARYPISYADAFISSSSIFGNAGDRDLEIKVLENILLGMAYSLLKKEYTEKAIKEKAILIYRRKWRK